jgi:UDP-N-acetylmuramoyl-tripeptide--D-alanyl-D-alanine ligase
MISWQDIKTLDILDAEILKTTSFNKIEIDSRLLDQNSLFVALKGERFDGADFIQEAFKLGCCNFILNLNAKNKEIANKLNSKASFVFVNDTTTFLGELASLIVKKFKINNGKVITISGSNGKTTTKEMVYAILDHLDSHCCIKTLKNNNNHIGVPLTIFQIRENTKYAVIELGSNHPGEIEPICRIAQPDVAFTTNIGDTHLEFFHSLDDVFEEEAWPYYYIREFGGLFVRNCDDAYLNTLAENDFVINLGSAHEHYCFLAKENYFGLIHKNKEYEILSMTISGRYNYFNLFAAISLAHLVTGVDLEKIVQAATSFAPSNNRSEWKELDGCKIFLDAYNANPSSMKVAIEGFKITVEQQVNLDEVALILGDMNELGTLSSIKHRELGEFIRGLGFKHVYFIGKFSEEYRNGFGLEGKCFSKREEFDVKQLLKNYKYLFIKGSRSLQLERIIDIN